MSIRKGTRECTVQRKKQVLVQHHAALLNSSLRDLRDILFIRRYDDSAQQQLAMSVYYYYFPSFFFTLIVIARTNGGVRAGGFFSPVIYEPLLPTLAAASIAGQSQRFTCSFLPFVFDSFLPIPPPARFPTIYFDDSPFVFISFAFWPFVFFFVDGHLFYSSPRVLIQFDPHSLQHR